MIITVTKRNAERLANIYRSMRYYFPADPRPTPKWYITNHHVVPQLANDDDTTQMDVPVSEYQGILTMIREYDETSDSDIADRRRDTQPLRRWLAAYALPAAVEEADRQDLSL